MIRDEFKPEGGWREYGSDNPEITEWLNDKKIRLKRIGKDGVRHMTHTDFDWMYMYGCYAMNDKAIAAEFRLLFG